MTDFFSMFAGMFGNGSLLAKSQGRWLGPRQERTQAVVQDAKIEPYTRQPIRSSEPHVECPSCKAWISAANWERYRACRTPGCPNNIRSR